MSYPKAFKCNNIDKKIKANDAILKILFKPNIYLLSIPDLHIRFGSICSPQKGNC